MEMRRVRIAVAVCVFTLPMLALADVFAGERYHGWEEDAQVESLLIVLPAVALALTQAFALRRTDGRRAAGWADLLRAMSCAGAVGWGGLLLLRLSFGASGKVWLTLALLAWASIVCLANAVVVRVSTFPVRLPPPLPQESPTGR